MKMKKRALRIFALALLAGCTVSKAAIVQWDVNASSSKTPGEIVTGYFDYDTVNQQITDFNVLVSGISNSNTIKTSDFVAGGFSAPTSFSFQSTDPGGGARFITLNRNPLPPSLNFVSRNGGVPTTGLTLYMNMPYPAPLDGSVSFYNISGSNPLPSYWEVIYPSQGVFRNPTISENDIDIGSITYKGVVGGAVAPVPEPETYVLLLAGLGLIGVAVKRRKARQA
jgi:hypothetical protein